MFPTEILKTHTLKTDYLIQLAPRIRSELFRESKPH